MPGCAAVGCNNRSEKGYIMKCFPRDPKLRKIWQERVARADWEPSNNSFLCHIHFEPQEWVITQSGKIRLKKNAVPSIFTITSNRKSPKKSTKLFNIKEDNISFNEFGIDLLENDSEHSSTDQMEDKISDSQDMDAHLVTTEEKMLNNCSNTTAAEKDREDFQKAYQRIHANPSKDNVIEISDDNLTDTVNTNKEDNVEITLNNSKKDNITVLTVDDSVDTQSSITIVKEEIKPEIIDQNTFDNSYDEIEEKLKQICDGGDETYNAESKIDSTVKNSEENNEQLKMTCNTNNTEPKVALSIDINHTFSGKNDTVADKRENVEMIFGVESADEKVQMCKSPPNNKHVHAKLDNADDNSIEIEDMICIKEEKKIFAEDIEQNFSKEEVHVIPNIRAALKRKRRSKEEILKTIKKSIRNPSDPDPNSSSNSELSESEEEEVEERSKLPISNSMNGNGSSAGDIVETTEFVIKVTGDPEDVTEIIEELSINAISNQISQKVSAPVKNLENDTFVTSVITVLSSKNTQNRNDNAQDATVIKDECSRLDNKGPILNPASPVRRGSLNIESVHSLAQCQSSCCKYSALWSDDETKNRIKNVDSERQAFGHNAQVLLENKSANCSSYENLLEKVKIQDDVIAKLTDQLIIYKELENSLRNQDKEVEGPMHKINTRSNHVQSSGVTKKNLESKQRLIDDLSHRVNYFEEINKKLMKTVTLESQQKRKLESQLKQKDNRIKELNWKLEKASKYLERAEKNTNTYRRKMLNMQTIMRRKKLLDEKMSRFNELLIDSSKQEFSDKALAMSDEIRKACGKDGYDKLLSYGFPLPPLPALRNRLSGDLAEYDEHNGSKVRNHFAKVNIKSENMPNVKNEMEDETNDFELSEIAMKEEHDGDETVTGTVQDIFEENNDGDDFSTNELREHFILQLNAVM